MTLTEYRSLDELEQLLEFWKAVEIGEYSEGLYSFECRQLGGFYIELTTYGGAYVKLHSHMDTNRLDRYLDKSDLSVLLFP
jgi:hypothetical protein